MTSLGHLDLPEGWRPVAIAPDGAPAQQLALIAERFGDDRRGPDHAVRRLVGQSQRASRAGIGFAAVLIERDHDDAVLAGSLTVSCRTLPGADDPALAADAVLQVLRSARRAPGTRTLGRQRGHGRQRAAELVALSVPIGEQPPAVLVRDEAGPDDGTPPTVLTQVHRLLPGTSTFMTVTVTTPNLELADAFAAVALSVASSLRIGSGSVPDQMSSR